jgi:type IV pilus assembly protein PilW
MMKLKGFTIVEMMIAISLGALLIASVSAIYVSNKTTYIVQQALARLQENGRFAAFSIARELRMAGYSGCANLNNIVVTNLTGNAIVYNFDRPIEGFEGSGGTFDPVLPANLTGLPIDNSDVLVIRSGSSTGVQLSAPMAQPDEAITVYDRLTINADTAMLITDCSIGDVFIASAGSNNTNITHSTTTNSSDNLSIAYGTNANVMIFNYFAYFVADTGRLNEANQPITALIRVDKDGNQLEIAEGVEQMQIIYGIDTDGDNTTDSFMTASQVEASNNWNNVLSAQIRLLMATSEEINDKPVSYTFNNTTITPTDHKLRKEWDLFVTFRNRGMPT